MPKSRFGLLPEYRIPKPRQREKRSLSRFQPNLRPQVESSNISNLRDARNIMLSEEDKLKPVTMAATRRALSAKCMRKLIGMNMEGARMSAVEELLRARAEKTKQKVL